MIQEGAPKMKKTIVLFVIFLLVCPVIFAAQFFGADQNLNLNGAFTFMLLSNQLPKTAEQKRDNQSFSVYEANAIGFKVEAQYDKKDFPVDLYLNGTFTFPNKYKLASNSVNKFNLEAANALFDDARTSWTMTKIACGALYDLNFGFDKEKLPLYFKVGGGMNYSFLLTKNTCTKNSIKFSDVQNYESIGVEVKTDVKYFIGSNMYAQFGLDAGYSFLGFYSDMVRLGDDYHGTKVPIQFASGFNMTANLGLSYSF